MKNIRGFAVLAMMAGAAAHGASAGASGGGRVTVCMDAGGGLREMARARVIASEIFREIAVIIYWRVGRLGCPAGSIVVSLSYWTPHNLMPGALAYAKPYEGMHIVLFYDRVTGIYGSNQVPVLGHVLVHEITHILEGISRHSASGVMKACWTSHDIAEMRRKSLEFDPEDIELIHAGLAVRTRRALAASAGAPTEVATNQGPK